MNTPPVATAAPFLGQRIIREKAVTDASGKRHDLHSHTSEAQCRFLQRFVSEQGVSTVLEIGMAYGISALFLCEALAGKYKPKYIGMDPLQHVWNDVGLLNLERAGFDFVNFYREPSRDVLPRLLASGEKIDFAYIDATKVFDTNLVDVVYVHELLRVGGYLAFDDVGCRGMHRLVRYLTKWPSLRVAGVHGVYEDGFKRRMAHRVIATLPRRLQRMFREDLVTTDKALGVNGLCVVFQKISEDQRRFDWAETP